MSEWVGKGKELGWVCEWREKREMEMQMCEESKGRDRESRELWVEGEKGEAVIMRQRKGRRKE